MTTMKYNGEEIELAKYTLSISEQVEEVNKEREPRPKAEKMWALMSDIIGERLPELVDGDDYETCDLTVLVDLYNEADEAYGKAMRKHQIEREEQELKKVEKLKNDVVIFNKAIQNATKNDPQP